MMIGRRALTVGILGVILSALMVLPAQARTRLSREATVRIEPAVMRIHAGQSFSIDVVLESDAQTRGTQHGLSFDPSLLQLDSVKEGSFYKDWATANGASTAMLPAPAIDNVDGRVPTYTVIVVGGASPEVANSGPMGTGVLCTYDFTAKRDVTGQTSIALTDVVVAERPTSRGVLPVPVSVLNGEAVVAPPALSFARWPASLETAIALATVGCLAIATLYFAWRKRRRGLGA